MVAEEIAFPVGVPSPVAVGLGIMPFAATGRAAIFLTFTDPLFPLLCGSTDRSAVTGKGQMARNDQSFMDGQIEELLFIKAENKEKRISRFELPAFQKGKEPGSHAGRIVGSLITFLFPFRRLHFREAVFGREIGRAILPNAGKEIIKSANTGSIPERETAEDGIKGSFPEHAAPGRDGSYFQFQSKQIGAQHAGREPGFRAKNRVALPHNGISQGEIQIPELHDIIPGTFRKHEGIGIKRKEIGYERILIGGMAARITR